MFRAFVVTALLVGNVAFARAETDEKTERARIHLKAAIAYYDEGKYDDAAREMNQAYSLKPLADLQYNLAQCYERLNRLTEAIVAYDAYLAGKSDAPDRKQVAARIESLRERAKADATGAPPPPPPPAEKVVFKTIVVYKEMPPPPGRAARWAAGGLTVLAAAGLASGIAFAVLAKQAADEVSTGGNPNNPMPWGGAPRDAEERGQSYPIISGVSFGVGALAGAGAIALFLVARKIDREAPKLTLAPTVGGAVLAGSF